MHTYIHTRLLTLLFVVFVVSNQAPSCHIANSRSMACVQRLALVLFLVFMAACCIVAETVGSEIVVHHSVLKNQWPPQAIDQMFSSNDWRASCFWALFGFYTALRLAADIIAMVKSLCGAACYKRASEKRTSTNNDDSAPTAPDLVLIDMTKPLVKTPTGDRLHTHDCSRIKATAMHRRTELQLCSFCIPKGVKGKDE